MRSPSNKKSSALVAGLFSSGLPALGGAMVFLIWWSAVHVFLVDPQLLPPPESVLRALWRGVFEGRLHQDISATLAASVVGLLIGSTIGITAGIAVGEFGLLNRFVYPVVLGLQSMPTIAIAPLIIVWLGFEIGAKIVVVSIACFFPTFVATVAGMNATNRDLLDLYRVFSASRWRTVCELKFPGALHYIFGGLQVAVILSIIACVVSEFLASIHGLGYQIKSLSEQLDVSSMFAPIVLLSVLGSVGTKIVRWMHGRVVFWDNA